MIAGEDEHIFRIDSIEPVQVLIDRIGGAFIPVRSLFSLLRRENGAKGIDSVEAPVLAVAYIGIQNA